LYLLYRVKLAQIGENQLFAIKIFRITNSLISNVNALVSEVKVMKEINHPNLVNLIEFNEAMPYQVTHIIFLLLLLIEKEWQTELKGMQRS
jgi:hypothetical protein